MKIKQLSPIVSLFLLLGAVSCHQKQNPTEEEVVLAKPSEVQYKWHEQERLMFLCLDPCTWQGREYDNHSTPLSGINPSKLDPDQWCETALLWGAKEILFVAKHTGGFCWWQTETTDYGIKETPYKNGKGDVLLELSKSCKKYGLNLGIYVYPGDDNWGAGIGSGGQTADPSDQEAYNEVFRRQLTEVLTKYGKMIEVWFDGSCVIDVADIMEEYASNSVVFQGPHASLRWPGTESGKLFYPAWNTVKSEDLKSGVSTQIHGTPDGDSWAPLETNTTLYDHFWFWSQKNEEKRKPLDELVECYYRSVGYGSVFLLNSTPDTSGLIPEADRKLYKAFGDEIDRRFKTSLARVENVSGTEVILELPLPRTINHVVTMEDYRLGHRIREYRIDGFSNGKWEELCTGQSVGRKKIDYFRDLEVSKIRFTVTKNVNTPVIRNLSVYFVEEFIPPTEKPVTLWSAWQTVSQFNTGENRNIELNLSGRINIPGQFIVRLENHNPDVKIEIENVELFYDGRKVLDGFSTVKGNEIIINRTPQVTDESQILLRFSIKDKATFRGDIQFKPAIIY